MKLDLKITGDRAVATQVREFRGQKTEPYTVSLINEAEGSNRAIAGILRTLADDIDPPLPDHMIGAKRDEGVRA